MDYNVDYVWIIYGLYMDNSIDILVGVFTPLKNMSSSVGMMTFRTEWKNNPVMFQSPPTSSVI